MNLAVRDIKADWIRFALAALGLGAILVAVIGINGFYRGIVFEALLVLNNIGGDMWVVQGETVGPFNEPSRIASTLDLRLEGVPGVVQARRFVQLRKRILLDRQTRDLTLIGIDFPKDRGDRLRLVDGRSLQSGHYEAIADRSMGLTVGDTVRFGRDDYTIVGVTAGQVDPAGDPLMFVSVSDARSILEFTTSEAVLLSRQANRANLDPGAQKGNIAAVVLDLEPGTHVESVRDLILRWGDVNVLSSAEQRDAILNGQLARLRLQILAFVATMFAVAAGVVAVTIFSMTMAKISSIALLKLIGARERVVVAMIVQTAIALGLCAFVGAVAVSYAIFPRFPRSVVLLPQDILTLFVLTMAICAAASWAGIQRAVGVRAREALA